MGRIPCYRLGIPHRFATTLYKGTVAGVRESALMEFPTRDTMITSASPTCQRVFRYTHGMVWSICLNRSCACKAFPELRSSPNSADISELELPCTEKGGDTMIHSQVTTRVQMGDDTAPDGVVSEDTINGLPSNCQSPTDDDEGDQGLTEFDSRFGLGGERTTSSNQRYYTGRSSN